MKWIRERDALISQTLAFVQSVTGRREEPPRGAQAAAPVSSEPDPEFDELAEVRGPVQGPPDPPLAAAPRKVSRDIENEMRDRIEGFRRHQERFRREREEYFSATLARLRAAIRDAPPPRPGK